MGPRRTAQADKGIAEKVWVPVLVALLVGGSSPWWWGPLSSAIWTQPAPFRLVAENNGAIVKSHNYRISDAALEISPDDVHIRIKAETRGATSPIPEPGSPWINFRVIGADGKIILEADGDGRDKLTVAAPGEIRPDITGWFRAKGISAEQVFAQRHTLRLQLILPE